MLAPVTEADFGEEEAALRLCLAARERWPAFAARLEEETGRSTGFRESGALVVAADTGDSNDSAAMNLWLHAEVMKKLAQSGGKIPASLQR